MDIFVRKMLSATVRMAIFRAEYRVIKGFIQSTKPDIFSIYPKIEGMTDHIVIPATHSFMMFNQNVMEQVQHFLEHSKFSQEASND